VSQYDTEIDLDNANNSQTQAALLVGRDKRVLDVGCWKGDLGRALRGRGCHVSGVDIDETAAAVAREHLDQVVVADLERTPLSSSFAGQTFDAIVFADVLEHVTDPLAVLSDAKGLLGPDGFVVLSIPNVTHGSVRLALLQGLWDYADTGHLDRTHLRFFSRRGLVGLVRDAGFAIDHLGATVVDVLGREVTFDGDLVPPGAVEWVRDQTDSMVYQFIVRARPSDTAVTADVPPLLPAVPFRTLRPVDEWTAQAQAETTKEHRLLTQRDHIIGLEAAVSVAQERARKAESGLRTLRQRVKTKNVTITRLRKRLRATDQRVRRLEAKIAEQAPSGGVLGRVRRRLGTRLRPGGRS
jgi:2-polyprenyl-3-methyl-5-hydroxy-6-metoxy-1,4-benzoquinol methylase